MSSILTFPGSVLAQNAYKFLEVGLFGTGDTIDLTNPAQFETFIKSAYTLFLTICIVAAVIMIVIHGLEYMLTSIPMVKVKAKGRLWSAIGGLLIALTAWLFLSTLNPKFVDLNLDLGQILINNNSAPVTNGEGGDDNDGGDTTGLSTTNNHTGSAGQLATNNLSGPKKDGETSGQAILRNAEYAADKKLTTSQVSGTNGGRRACVYATNTIIDASLGSGVTDNLGTPAMLTALQGDSRFESVPGGISSAQPGDIIISPSQGSATGHVGVCKTSGCSSIISNSSKQGAVAQNFTNTSWQKHYSSLGTYIFRAK